MTDTLEARLERAVHAMCETSWSLVQAVIEDCKDKEMQPVALLNAHTSFSGPDAPVEATMSVRTGRYPSGHRRRLRERQLEALRQQMRETHKLYRSLFAGHRHRIEYDTTKGDITLVLDGIILAAAKSDESKLIRILLPLLRCIDPGPSGNIRDMTRYVIIDTKLARMDRTARTRISFVDTVYAPDLPSALLFNALINITPSKRKRSAVAIPEQILVSRAAPEPAEIHYSPQSPESNELKEAWNTLLLDEDEFQTAHGTLRATVRMRLKDGKWAHSPLHTIAHPLVHCEDVQQWSKSRNWMTPGLTRLARSLETLFAGRDLTIEITGGASRPELWVEIDGLRLDTPVEVFAHSKADGERTQKIWLADQVNSLELIEGPTATAARARAQYNYSCITELSPVRERDVDAARRVAQARIPQIFA